MGCSIPLLASLVSTLGGLVFGYELGIISGALLQLKAEFCLSCVQQEALVSSLLCGALLASTMGGCLIDRHCRRNTILLSNILLLTGTLVLLISSYSALVLGRITVGFAMCISSMSCCIFVSEVVTPDRRGFMVILYEAGITVGILFAYAINYILSDSRSGWKWMFGLAIVPILVQLVSVWFLPSSTRAEADLMSPTETQQADDKQKCDSMYLFHRKDNMRTRTVIGLGLVLFQQFTGQPNILFYASTIFDSVGFQSGDSAVLASAGLGLVKVIATLTSMVLSDRVGRRPMLISGCSVMALCLITIGLLSGHSPMNTKRPCHLDFNVNTTDLPTSPADGRSDVDMPLDESHGRLYNNTEDENLVFDKVGLKTLEPASESPSSVSGSFVSWIILMCMMAVVSAYSVGFGPMTWLLLSEIFPAAVRGRAFAFINCFNWAANLLVTFTFLNVVDAIGLSKMFVLYGITAVAAAVFVYLVLPETKGMTLEAIDEELRLSRFYSGDKFCGCISRTKTQTQYQRVHCHITTSG
ncbi:solute carrier family 2, facilitated glucose transporter member 10 [Scophthalmus maximus]|uniref:Solute carrier family 2, facilitated glucose transporter member 10 n=1 Tax=Scophthalmus maximus TaxID=52904 RepID=A0A8D3B202_SCOMX|nr:solute carrier family 2, facilitated glucose transporter member 10 [Scophthalmus maximus]